MSSQYFGTCYLDEGIEKCLCPANYSGQNCTNCEFTFYWLNIKNSLKTYQ